MRALCLLLATPLVLADGFPASKYEMAATFTGALVRGDLRRAQRMLTPNAKLMEWSGGPHALADVSRYMQHCPLKSIEGNEQLNINVILDCSEGYHGMSLLFSGDRISEVDFGPPPVIQIVTPANSNG
ncbi:hypothetical protein [Sphingomonas sp.]|uniref:hypothetical protein n=1 Tax=Sphingomonas sp. TaxID=28214 RepID=UPI003CC6AFBC